MEHINNIDDGLFDFKHYGNTVFRPEKKWAGWPRSDLIKSVENIDTLELDKGLVIEKTVSLTTTHTLCALKVKYWDCFCDRGTRCTILDY